MIRKYQFILAATVGALILAAAPSAHAVATLRITNSLIPAQTITITDGGGTDTIAGLNGAIGYTSAAGFFTGWTITVTTALSKGTLGAAGSTVATPIMDLNIVAVSSTSGTLLFEFSDDGWGGPSGTGWLATFGGTINTFAGSSLTYTTFLDDPNAIFGTTTSLTTQAFGTGAVSGSAGKGPTVQTAPYSLTQKFSLVHGGAGTTSGDGTLTTPDGGTTVALLGFSLLGLAGLRRKFATA